nr:hypothetical membrane protein [uncultured archaeon]CBH40005.1 hypothetical membrane protein [uncultured archaeon]
MDKKAIGVIFSLIAIFVLPPAIILIYNLEYYANALSSVVIATATVIYATLTYLLLLEQRRKKEKPRIQEISDFVINPLVKRLESQKSYLKKGDFGWEKIRDTGYVTNITELTSPFWGIKKLIYADFKTAYSKVAKKIEVHDNMVEKLKESLKEFADEIKSLPDFQNKVSERFEGYNEKPFYASLFEPTDKNFGFIPELIVKNQQELNEHYTYHKFWSLYGKEFLRFREGKEVKECKTEVERRRKNLLELEGGILKDLMGILKIYIKEYGITYRWMKEAEDREIEEKLGLT